MNKKLVAIIVAVVAVLAVVGISIWGGTFDVSDKTVSAQSIKITNTEIPADSYYGTTIKTMYKEIEPGTTTYTIYWNVLPVNTSKKQISLTSNNEDVTITDINQQSSEEGSAVINFGVEDDVIITLRTTDGSSKVIAIHFHFRAPDSMQFDVTLTPEELTFAPAPGSTNIMTYDETTLVLIENNSYTLTGGIDLTIPSGTDSTFEDSVLIPQGLGEFQMEVTDGVNTHTQNVKVIADMQTFMIGDQYQSYKNIIADFASGDPENSPYDFNTRVVSPYLVGNENDFHFDMNIRRAGIGEGAVISLNDIELDYTVYEGTSITGTPLTFSEIATIVDNQILFDSSSVGETFTFSIVPKYNMREKSPLAFTITVTEGINVWTHEDLRANFANLDVNQINIHSQIVPTLLEAQLYEGKARNYAYIWKDVDPGYMSGSPYTRGYKATDEGGKNHLIVNGNFFMIDGTNLPLVTTSDVGGLFGNLDWAETAGFDIASVQEGIFKISDERDATSISDANNLEVTYNNLKVAANSAKSAIYPEDFDPTDPEFEDWDEVEQIEAQGSGYVAFMSKSSVTNFNNTVATKALIAYWNAYEHSKMNINGSIGYDIWGQGLYSYGGANVNPELTNGTEITLTNTKFTRLGASVICYEDVSWTIETDPVEADLIFTINEGVVFDNYVSGTEGWFVVNGFTSVIPTFKSQINGVDTNSDGIVDTGVGAIGKSIIKTENIGGSDYEMFNYIFQITAEYSAPQSSDPRYREPSDNIQLTINQINNETEVLSAIELNPDMTPAELEALRTYQTITRRSGFKENHPFITEGTYLGAIGDYSNIDDFKLLQNVVGVVGGYLQNDPNIQSMLNNFGTETLTVMLNSYNAVTGKSLTETSQLASDYGTLGAMQQNALIGICSDKILQDLIISTFLNDVKMFDYATTIVGGYLTSDASMNGLISYVNTVDEDLITSLKAQILAIANVLLSSSFDETTLLNTVPSLDPGEIQNLVMGISSNMNFENIQAFVTIANPVAPGVFLDEPTAAYLPLINGTRTNDTALGAFAASMNCEEKKLLEINPDFASLGVDIGQEFIFIVEFFDIED